MVLQSSGPIKFSDIQSEFGGSNPISFSEYYKDGSSGYVVADGISDELVNTHTPGSSVTSTNSDYSAIDSGPIYGVENNSYSYVAFKNKAGKPILELRRTEDTATFKYSKLLPTITEEDYNKPEFPILNYIKLTSNVGPAYKLEYIKIILDNEINSDNGWKIGKYYVIENTKKMSNEFEALIDIVPIVNGNDIKTESELKTYINNLNANGVKYIGYIEYDPYSSKSKEMHNNSRLLKPVEQTARKTDKYIISENYMGSDDFPFFMLIKRIAGL